MTMMTATQALSVNPATGQTLAAMPWANAQEIEHALSLAASGFKKWKLTSVAQRAQTLRDIGQALRAHAEEMAQCITREMGKPIKQARAEVTKSAALILAGLFRPASKEHVVARAMDNAILETILQRVRPLIGQGKVADYIPALASVEGSKLGIAICTVDGQHYQAGDAHERFSIQSISKVLSLVVAMRHYPEEEIWQRVGKDPSGSPFNSLVQLEMEQGIPRNPFINAGALVVCDMLQGRLSAPRQRMLEVVRALCGVSDITYDATAARSEFEHSARNAAIAWLMKSFGNFHHDVPTVLQNYFHYCALKMSCMELARTFVFLANQGEAFHLDEPVVTPMQARQINALMATSGMYQNAGELAWRVGLPAKSGVGGGIVAIVPHEMAIAVWSPELDPAGNSLAGIAALEQLTQTLGRSVY